MGCHGSLMVSPVLEAQNPIRGNLGYVHRGQRPTFGPRDKLHHSPRSLSASLPHPAFLTPPSPSQHRHRRRRPFLALPATGRGAARSPRCATVLALQDKRASRTQRPERQDAAAAADGSPRPRPRVTEAAPHSRPRRGKELNVCGGSQDRGRRSAVRSRGSGATNADEVTRWFLL